MCIPKACQVQGAKSAVLRSTWYFLNTLVTENRKFQRMVFVEGISITTFQNLKSKSFCTKKRHYLGLIRFANNEEV
jgi:hypothetical protein